MTSSRKEKRPERDLVMVIIFSAFCALAMFGMSLFSYFHIGRQRIDANSVSIATYDGVVDLAYTLSFDIPLAFGIAFFVIGYGILKAYRKLKPPQKTDHKLA